MNIKLTLTLLAASIGLCASAITATSTPGKLSEVVGENINVTSLAVSGEMNAADFEFIAEKMTSLTTLDLTDATIVAYSGNPILLGRTDYPANTIPAYALAGTPIQAISFPKNLQIIDEGAFSSSKLATILR